MKKIIVYLGAALLMAACGNNTAAVSSGEQEFNVVDSLVIDPELGELQTNTFQGLLPAASCPGIEYTLILHNQQNSGDGVYKLTMRYLEAENGKDLSFTTYGRQHTLRGDAVDVDATVYQLVPFDSDDNVNLLLLPDGNLELINANLERAETTLNYVLKKL